PDASQRDYTCGTRSRPLPRPRTAHGKPRREFRRSGSRDRTLRIPARRRRAIAERRPWPPILEFLARSLRRRARMGRGALAPQRSAPAFFFSASCKLRRFPAQLEARQKRCALGFGLWGVVPLNKEKNGRRELGIRF